MLDVDAPHRTFADVWRRAVDQHGEPPSSRSEAGTGIDTWTYREFDLIVDDTAALLATNGVAAGDAVHLCLRNSPAFIAVWLATAKLGAWMVPVDPASSMETSRPNSAASQRIGFATSARRSTVAWRRAAPCGPWPWRRQRRTSNRGDGSGVAARPFAVAAAPVEPRTGSP